jgi:tRNA A37 threonylcarbamoyltransferase TsaD
MRLVGLLSNVTSKCSMARCYSVSWQQDEAAVRHVYTHRNVLFTNTDMTHCAYSEELPDE